jgi:hypothetical protein
MSEHDHDTVADLIDWAAAHPDARWEATAPLMLDEGVQVTVGITPRSLHTEWVPEANASSAHMLPRVRVSMPGAEDAMAGPVDPGRYQAVIDELVAGLRPTQIVALRAVERSLRRQREAELDLAAAQAEFGDTIRSALAAGVKVPALATATDLSESRIYQIRDRRR